MRGREGEGRTFKSERAPGKERGKKNISNLRLRRQVK